MAVAGCDHEHMTAIDLAVGRLSHQDRRSTEVGAQLSEGQRLRLLLARAPFAGFEVAFLEEATAQLKGFTAALVVAGNVYAANGRTRLMSTHGDHLDDALLIEHQPLSLAGTAARSARQ
jgi:ABC-type transport system involved in cytochrome bd biosynthesis fused ATPase/permease subunit